MILSLPEELNDALLKETARVSSSKLSVASKELSERYRSPERDRCPSFMSTDVHRLAYLAARMPATYAVVHRVLSELKQRIPHIEIKSVLDIGAGPGTATWAAAELFPGLTSASLVENDENWLNIGKGMMLQSKKLALQNAVWCQSNLQESVIFPQHDLVIMSYVVGELKFEELPLLISQGLQSTSQVIVIVEPGTPHGFERIRIVRDQLIKNGAFLIAPCPHEGRCPMEKGDWCHFSERLQRSSLHQSVKDASLGYEDEKYSYVIGAKSSIVLPEARILRHPQKHSGHIAFELCTEKGFEERVISRRHGELYKQARKLEWGDVFPPIKTRERE